MNPGFFPKNVFAKTGLTLRLIFISVRVVTFILLILPFGSIAQHNYSLIDRKVRDIPFADTRTLAGQLASLGKTDREKVRAIFRWITEHIDYNVRIYNRNKTSPGLFYEVPDDSLAPLPSLNERIAAKVLYKKIAFCDGYSRLFKTLCDYAGIRCELVSGYARTNTNRSGRFGVNHTWNAVYLDSAWHLLDVTWASGFISYSNEYVKQYNDDYFLTPPGQFIQDHYPEDISWTLMPQPPSYREFNQSPFRLGGYIRSGITYYYPAKGIIETTVGDSIRVELKANKEVKNFSVSVMPVPDSSQFVIPVLFSAKQEKSGITYTIPPDAGDWLYVFCNDEPVLRYKLNVKKDMVKDK